GRGEGARWGGRCGRWGAVVSARSLAMYWAGSQYATRGSFRPAVISMCGYGCARTLSYGEYDRMQRYASASFGLPHSSYSITVSGSDASSIVFTTSTNGTSATTARNR